MESSLLDVPAFQRQSKVDKPSLNNTVHFIVCFFLIVVAGVILSIWVSQPSVSDSKLTNVCPSFSVDNTISIVQEVTKHGPHPTGSPAQNNKVIPYFFDEVLPDLEALAHQHNWNTNTSIVCDRGTVYIGGVPSSYENVCVSVFSIAPPNVDPTSPGIALSAHLDSIFHAPGAFDNAVNVALGTELVRGIIKTPDLQSDFHRPIHLIVGDGEELGLLISHVAINNFLDRIAFVLNLESVGYGGKMTLFRWTTHSEKLVLKHCSKAKNLLVSGVGIDVFNAGLIGSNTDYVHYSEVAPVADFAFVERSDRYHTLYDRLETDKEEQIMRKSVREGLVVLFDVVHSFCSDTSDAVGNWSNSIVFTLPLFGVVLLSPVVGLILHCLVLGSCIGIVAFLVVRSGKQSSFDHSIRNWVVIGSFPFVFVLLPIIVCSIFGYVLSVISPMTFHRHSQLSMVFYCLITLSCMFLSQLLLQKIQKQNHLISLVVSTVPFFVIYLCAVIFKLGSSILFGFILVASVLMVVSGYLNSSKSNPIKPIIFLSVSALIITLSVSSVAYLLLQLLPGNFSRMDENFAADLYYAIGVSFISMLLTGPLISFVHTTKKPNCVHLSCFCFVLSLPLLCILLFSVPYSSKTPLRYTVQHEIFASKNQSHLAFSFPHSAGLSNLEEVLHSHDYETFSCKSFIPLETNAVCVDAGKEVVNPPLIDYDYKCDDSQCNVTMFITTEESARLLIMFPDDIDVHYEGHHVGDIMGKEPGVMINLAKATIRTEWNFSFTPPKTSLTLRTLYSVYKNSLIVDTVIDQLMPEMSPWGYNWLPGTMTLIDDVTFCNN
ncbi:hypothetical protein P9112_011585 [Eukaryota sp. TZLM1-RC]